MYNYSSTVTSPNTNTSTVIDAYSPSTDSRERELHSNI